MSDLHSDDCYQLRKVQMDADRKGLDARKAQQELERLLLELEHKYGLIADGRTIDPRTATIQGTLNTRRNNGKESQDSITASIVDTVAV